MLKVLMECITTDIVWLILASDCMSVCMFQEKTSNMALFILNQERRASVHVIHTVRLVVT